MTLCLVMNQNSVISVNVRPSSNKCIVKLSDGQKRFPALVKAAERGRVVTFTRGADSVACMMSFKLLRAMFETLEIMADPAAMKAIRDHKAGKLKFRELTEIPD
jgi:antitoxin YefM